MTRIVTVIDISKHGANEIGNVKMAGPGFVNDVTAWWPGLVPKKFPPSSCKKQINKQNSYLLLALLQSGSVPELDMCGITPEIV